MSKSLKSKDLKNNQLHSFVSRVLGVQETNNTKKPVCKLSENNLHEKRDAKDKLSPDKRDGLIRKYIYLVNWVVGRLPLSSLKGLDRDDLIGFGTIGLIEAVDRFDPSRTSSFESFAITRIRGAVYDQLRASDWLTRGSRKKVKNLHKTTASLENKLGRYPSNTEIAGELGISLEDLRAIQQEAQIGIFSLDEPRDVNSDDGVTVVDSVSSKEAPHLENLEESELKERLAKAIDTLPEREKAVVGLYHYNRLTFREIADVMDFSESRASQIHARAISLLKSRLLKD